LREENENFLGGRDGVIGQRLAALLHDAKHEVTARRVGRLWLRCCVRSASLLSWSTYLRPMRCGGGQAARPDVIIHQLTDLPSAPGTPAIRRRKRSPPLRIEGTRNLMQAAKMVGVRRVVAQSIAFVYAPGEGTHVKMIHLTWQPRAFAADGARHYGTRARGAANAGIAGVVLRYGYFMDRAPRTTHPKAAVGPR